MSFMNGLKTSKMEIEDILLIYIVRMNNTIFSDIQQSKHKW